MTKSCILDGADVAGYLKQRHAESVKGMIKKPVLRIISSGSDPSIDVYARVKERYGDDIGVVVVTERVRHDLLPVRLKQLNDDELVDGVILQLPLDDMTDVDELCSLIDPRKDVDNLSGRSYYDSPTATAVLWLLAGYGIDLEAKKIVLVGNGRLVGRPLGALLVASGFEPLIVDDTTVNKDELISSADVIVSGVGLPGVVRSSSIKPGAVVVDAGVASEGGVMKGDVEESARERDDIWITPLKGGVGPLTVAALFDNVLRAANYS